MQETHPCSQAQNPNDTCAHETGTRSVNPLITSAHATLHCLIGCTIGEVTGLLIGVSMGLGVFWTIALAVFLAFVVGISLAVLPVMRDQGLSLREALSVVWLGEVASISVMEIVMNAVDYAVGGVQAMSVFSPIFWIGLAVAIPAGFLAAWPVNHWLISRHLKACAH